MGDADCRGFATGELVRNRSKSRPVRFLFCTDTSIVCAGVHLPANDPATGSTATLRSRSHFVAADGVRWIVDYKFVEPERHERDEPAALASRLSRQCEQYSVQLAAYRDAFSPMNADSALTVHRRANHHGAVLSLARPVASLRVTRFQLAHRDGWATVSGARFSEKSKTCCQRFRSALRKPFARLAIGEQNPIKSSASALRPTRIHTMTVLPRSAAIPRKPTFGAGPRPGRSLTAVPQSPSATLTECIAAIRRCWRWSVRAARQRQLLSVALTFAPSPGSTSRGLRRKRHRRDCSDCATKLLCIWAVGVAHYPAAAFQRSNGVDGAGRFCRHVATGPEREVGDRW